jgi:predicted amidophosphoribosyltransferase
MKLCCRCDSPALPKIKYCKDCKAELLSELNEAGYFTPRVYGHKNRTDEQKEITRETKLGIDR